MLEIMSGKTVYDLCVIGGGINGCGIARDAAGRGLSVLLLEKDDLASATSSKSSGFIHGGLRYLEQFEFGLVREALTEREVLLNAAPHIIWPLEFVLPHRGGLCDYFKIMGGLSLYDNLGRRKKLPASRRVNLAADHPSAVPLQTDIRNGFSYYDCWVEDSRLVVLNAMDAEARGATIKTYTECTGLSRTAGGWDIETDKEVFKAKLVVNAAGPWVRKIVDSQNLAREKTPQIRLVKGSHIIVPRLYDGDHCYILRQPDGRVVFVIPYQGRYTSIGTTDIPVDHDPADAMASQEEMAYLCGAVNRYFDKKIEMDDVIWTYSGVRPLMDSGEENPSEVTRGYRLILDDDNGAGAPIIHVFGGKLTTYRTLSQAAVNKITRYFDGGVWPEWTAGALLPGGNIADADFPKFLAEQLEIYPHMPRDLVERYVHAYGTCAQEILCGGDDVSALGRHYGDDLYEAEVKYLLRREFARTADDILWRRSKLGLHISDQTRENLEEALESLDTQEVHHG